MNGKFLLSFWLGMAAFMPLVCAENLVSGTGWYEQFASTEATVGTIRADVNGKTQGVIRLKCMAPAQPFYKIIYGQIIAADIPSSHRLRLTFQARSETNNPVRVVIEKATAPYTPVAEVNATLTPEWKSYSDEGTLPDFTPKGLGLRIQFGHQAGTLEFTGIKVEDMGEDTAAITARESLKAEAIKARIQKYRKGDLEIGVKDASGTPVKNAKVHVQMKRHAFLFGCNFFGLKPADDSPAQVAYRDRFTALFNYATLPFYWSSFEVEKGRPQYERLNAMALWCNAHDIVTKGHPLVWHETYPAWAPEDADAAIPLLKLRVTDIIRYYAQEGHGHISIWDVLNEASATATGTSGVAHWLKRDGSAKVTATVLQWARQAGKGGDETFIYNDFNTRSENIALLTALKKADALPDVIGLQSHMHGDTWPIDQLWATVERFSQFGRPIHFTETTVLSGPRRELDYKKTATDWNTTPEDEQRQADYTELFYTVLFSNSNVRGITWWDFGDADSWLGAPAGFLRKDMSPKPVYDRLMKKIHGEWWTDVEIETGAAGICKARVFYGDYVISATDAQGRSGTVKMTFPTGGAGRKLTVTLK